MNAYLPVDIQLPLEALASHLTVYVEAYLHQHHSWLDSSEVRQTEVRLKGPVRVLADDNTLVTDLSVEITAEVLPARFKSLGGIPLLGDLQRLGFALTLRFRTELGLSVQGILWSGTTVRYEWARKPKTAAGWVSLSAFFEGLIERALTETAQAIDTELPKLIDLPQIQGDVWQELWQWRSVKENPPLWFQFGLTQRGSDRKMQISPKGISLQLGLWGDLRLQLNDGSLPNDSIPTLPKQVASLPTSPPEPPVLSLQLPYAALNRWLVDQHYPIEGTQLQLQALELSPTPMGLTANGTLAGRWKWFPLRGTGKLQFQLLGSGFPIRLELRSLKLHKANFWLRMGYPGLGKKRLEALVEARLNELLAETLEELTQGSEAIEIPAPFLLSLRHAGERVVQVELTETGIVITYELQVRALVTLAKASEKNG